MWKICLSENHIKASIRLQQLIKLSFLSPPFAKQKLTLAKIFPTQLPQHWLRSWKSKCQIDRDNCVVTRKKHNLFTCSFSLLLGKSISMVSFFCTAAETPTCAVRIADSIALAVNEYWILAKFHCVCFELYELVLYFYMFDNIWQLAKSVSHWFQICIFLKVFFHIIYVYHSYL